MLRLVSALEEGAVTERGRDRDRKRSDREERMGGDGGGGCDRRRVSTEKKRKKNPGRGEKNVGETGESAEGEGWEEEEEERDARRGGKNGGRRGGGELQVDGLNFKAARPDEVCGLTM